MSRACRAGCAGVVGKRAFNLSLLYHGCVSCQAWSGGRKSGVNVGAGMVRQIVLLERRKTSRRWRRVAAANSASALARCGWRCAASRSRLDAACCSDERMTRRLRGQWRSESFRDCWRGLTVRTRLRGRSRKSALRACCDCMAALYRGVVELSILRIDYA